MRLSSLLILFSSLVVSQQLPAQTEAKKPSEGISSSMLSGLKLRSIGPAVTSGRVAAIAVDPSDESCRCTLDSR